MESEAEAPPPSTSTTGWARVLRISAAEIIGLMVIVMGLLAQGVDAPLLIFGLAFVAGLVLFALAPRPGAIMLLIVGTIFVLANIPFTLPTLFALNSPFEFVLNLLFLVGGFGTIIAAVNLVQGNDGAGRPGAGRWLRISGILAVLLTAMSIVVKLTDEQATAQTNDIRLVAQETEFSDDRLISEAGELGVFIENKDLFSHTFVIDELDVDLDLPGSSKKRVEFEARPGEYEYRCTILGHEDMKGILVVS